MLIKIKTKSFLQNIRNKLLNLYDNNLDNANKVANLLIKLSLDINSIDLITKDFIFIEKDKLDNLNNNIYKHVNKSMPIQYLEGFVEFLDLKVITKPPVLIPRLETEYWVYNLLKKLNKFRDKNLDILDLCTGTGCIALSLAKYFKNSKIYAVDISEEACNLAVENSRINNIENIIIIKSDLYNNLADLKFDIIVSNPPYISQEQFENLDPMVKNWEDKIALTSEDNGLEIIKRIVYNSISFLKINKELKLNNVPQVVLEIDYTQGKIVKDIILKNNFNKAEIIKDLDLKDRVAYAFL